MLPKQRKWRRFSICVTGPGEIDAHVRPDVNNWRLTKTEDFQPRGKKISENLSKHFDQSQRGRYTILETGRTGRAI